MNKWNFATYLFFVAVAYGTAMLIKHSKTDDRRFVIKGIKYRVDVNMVLFWIILTVITVSRNPFLIMATGKQPYANDTQAYIYYFSIKYFPGWDTLKIIQMKQTEPLFYLLCRVVRLFTTNYKYMWTLVYGIIAACYTYFMFSVCDKNTCYSIVPIYFVVYLYSLSAIRSGLSIGFAIISLLFLQKKRYFLSMCFFVLGFLSHYIIIFIYLIAVAERIYERLSNNKSYKKTVCVIFILILVVGTTCTLSLARSIIENTKYKVYLQQGAMTWKGQLIVISCGVCALLLYSEIRKIKGVSMFWVHLSILHLGVLPFIVNFNIYRVSYYFIFCRIITWGYILECIWMKVTLQDRRYIKIGVTFIAFIVFTKHIVDIHSIGLMPYFNQYF